MINEMILDNIMLRKLLYQTNEKLINFLTYQLFLMYSQAQKI